MSDPNSDSPARASTLIGWRLLALLYDLWPVLALWMLVSAIFNVAYSMNGHDARDYIAPYTRLWWCLWLVCWWVGAGYAVVSWARGGQTLGMRPWRLRLVSLESAAPTKRALLLRYAVGTVSVLLGGAGFWWAWLDRDRLTWHDRLSATRLIREPRRH